MHGHTFFLRPLALLFLATVCATAARAQSNATYVSATGNDANTCSRTAPCRTFSGAEAKTNIGGEITVLDSGEYGRVTINSALKITAVGVHATITVPANFNGVTIDATTTSTRVVLRGLTIKGLANSFRGIYYVDGTALTVEDCTITNMGVHGISIASGGEIFIRDTVVRNSSNSGIITSATNVHASGNVRLNVERSRFEDNFSFGVNIGVGTDAIVSNSVVAGNSSDGMRVTAVSAKLDIFNSVSSNNFYGAVAMGGGTIRVSGSAMINNTSNAIYVTGAGSKAISFGNNRLSGNGTDGTFTSTVDLQ